MRSSTNADGNGAVAGTLRRRRPVLELLAGGPRDQREVREALDRSRSTVYKALKELEEAGLVERRGDAYALTAYGRLAWQRHDEYEARLRRLEAARPLVGAIPEGRLPPPVVLERARIVLPSRDAPERPLECLEAYSGRSDRIRCLSPAGMPRYLAEIHAAVEAGERTVELLVESAALERLRSGYGRFEEAVLTEGLDVLRTDGTLPFAVVLFDADRLGLFAYDEGVLVGAAFSRDPDAVRWGEATYGRHRSTADRV